MRKLVIMFCIFLLYGCAHVTYVSPDGTRVTYTRVLTSSDEIKGSVPGAAVSVTGQKGVDAELLKAIVGTAVSAATK